MNLNLTWMESEWAQALGWTFVHSIWQIALIGLALLYTETQGQRPLYHFNAGAVAHCQ